MLFVLLRLSIECQRLSRRALSRRMARALLCSTGPVIRFSAASAPLLLELSVRLLARGSPLSRRRRSRPRFSAFTSSTDLRNLFSCSSGDILPRYCRLASRAGGCCCCCMFGADAVLAAALFCAVVIPAATGGLAATGGASRFLLLLSVLRFSCSLPCAVFRFIMEVYLGEACGRCCRAYCPCRVGDDLCRSSMLACLDSVLCLLSSPPPPPPRPLTAISSALLGGSVASAIVSDRFVSMRVWKHGMEEANTIISDSYHPLPTLASF